ncbi:MAG: hypothetical protein AAFR23_06270, partial [Pseudomonadota bacterium]
MITVEGLLFAALGFLIAGIAVVVLAPLYWARAVRLTTADLKSRMPISENQIAADRGLLKAEHAITVNRLENQLAELTTTSSAARVEINRRDAEIAALRARLTDRDADFAANESARRVLERTVMDRVPDVERHLRDARASLIERDEELDQLRTQATKAFRALDEAMQINEQQRQDIARLKDQIDARQAADQAEAERQRQDADGNGESASRVAAAASELTALRTKARSQAALITRLQRMLGDGADRRLVADGASAGGTTGDTVSSAEPRELLDSDARVLALEADLSRAEGRIDDRDRTIAALKQDLADYEARADAAMADRESSR